MKRILNFIQNNFKSYFFGVAIFIPLIFAIFHFIYHIPNVVVYVIILELAHYFSSLAINKMDEQDEKIDSLINTLKHSLEPMDRDNFYLKLLSLVSNAHQHVYLMYLRKVPPHEGVLNDLRKKYVDQLKELTISGKVEIDRIILNTPANLMWIQDVLTWYQNIPSFSLYVIDKLIPPVGVKIFDSEHLFLFYAGNIKGLAQPKFMYMKSTDMCRIYKPIFEETKAASICLMENGVVHSNNIISLGLKVPKLK